MAGQQGRLLHDGIVMAVVRMGIPAGGDGFMLITENREHVSETARCEIRANSLLDDVVSQSSQQGATGNFSMGHKRRR